MSTPRTYLVLCHTRRGPVVRRFSCPSSLDGYIGRARSMGCPVSFASPFLAYVDLV